MTEILHSFAELAKVMGCEKKARKVSKLATFMNIQEKCGRKAVVIWAFLQDQESCKASGPKGAILHDVERLTRATGYNVAQVTDGVIALIRSGYARASSTGSHIKAA